MATKIKPDYTPGDRVYELMSNRYQELNIAQAKEFIGHELEDFKMYWLETGKTKASWDSTCRNWMSRAYENKKENMARNRSYSGPQGDIFADALTGLKFTPVEETEAEMNKPGYVHPVQPQPQETISESDALEWMRQFGRVSR